MARTTRTRVCEACLTRPVRKRRGARYCSPCVAKKSKRPCCECGKEFAPDMMNGPRCRPCASKKAHEKRVGDTYGLKPGQYDELLAFQGGVSALGKQRPGAKRLAVDHDHSCCPGPISCGKCVRGLLTKHENFYIVGWLERFDDPLAVLENIRQYLTNPPARRLWSYDGED